MPILCFQGLCQAVDTILCIILFTYVVWSKWNPTSEVNIVHHAECIEMDTMENLDKRHQEQSSRSLGTSKVFTSISVIFYRC